MFVFPGGSEVKASACNVRDLISIPGLNPLVGKIPWRRKWQLTPVFLPGKSHGWGSLASYSPQSCKELDTTEQLTHKHKKTKGYRKKVWNENQDTIKRRKADLGGGRTHFCAPHLLLGSPEITTGVLRWSPSESAVLISGTSSLYIT